MIKSLYENSSRPLEIECLDDNWALVSSQQGCIWLHHMCGGWGVVTPKDIVENKSYCNYCKQSNNAEDFIVPKVYRMLLTTHVRTCEYCDFNFGWLIGRNVLRVPYTSVIKA